MNKKHEIEEKKIIVEDADGKKIEAEILFTFNENDEQFIMYEIDGVAYGAKLNEDDTLKPIEEDEWKLVERIYNEWLEDQEEEEDE